MKLHLSNCLKQNSVSAREVQGLLVRASGSNPVGEMGIPPYRRGLGLWKPNKSDSRRLRETTNY